MWIIGPVVQVLEQILAAIKAGTIAIVGAISVETAVEKANGETLDAVNQNLEKMISLLQVPPTTLNVSLGKPSKRS